MIVGVLEKEVEGCVFFLLFSVESNLLGVVVDCICVWILLFVRCVVSVVSSCICVVFVLLGGIVSSIIKLIVFGLLMFFYWSGLLSVVIVNVVFFIAVVLLCGIVNFLFKVVGLRFLWWYIFFRNCLVLEIFFRAVRCWVNVWMVFLWLVKCVFRYNVLWWVRVVRFIMIFIWLFL